MIQGISKFKGIFVAFYACYDTEGNVDEKKIAKLANWYLDKGVNGLYLTGSSGEGMLLSEQERMRTVDAAMDAVGGKITVIAHVGAKNTQEACRLAAQAAKAGVDAVSSVPNIYYPLPEICIEEYWDALIDAARLPFIIYNIPSTTGYNLSLNLFEKMIRKPYVAGIKTTSPDSSLILKMKAIGGDNTVIFHGEDAQGRNGRYRWDVWRYAGTVPQHLSCLYRRRHGKGVFMAAARDQSAHAWPRKLDTWRGHHEGNSGRQRHGSGWRACAV